MAAQSDTEVLAETLGALTLNDSKEAADKEQESKDDAEKGDTMWTLKRVAEALATGKLNRVVTMFGAGCSVAAGIPDFRTPGTGLYDNLAAYNLPAPEAVFSIDFFRENPKPFCTLAKELYPGLYEPTDAHRFIRLLADKGVLLRHYTQNIDTLEREAGVPDELLVEAHGSFATAHCIGCEKEYSQEWVRTEIFADRVPTCEDCTSLVKPDIVFFGEALPDRFSTTLKQDFAEADLLLVCGTSLAVHPFASLIHRVGDDVPRVLFNRDKVAMADDEGNRMAMLLGLAGKGFKFGRDDNTRDVFAGGDVQQSIRDFANMCTYSL
jgi:NAD-dependent protein deacetylase sirtuin 2